MKFKDGIKIGSSGGHGPIRYLVEKYDPETIIQFRFLKPEGFKGIHKFEIEALAEDQTQITHSIDMNTEGTGTLLWILGIRALHDALIEDAFDKLENGFIAQVKKTDYTWWVEFLRKQLLK